MPIFHQISRELLEAFYVGITEEEKELLFSLLNRVYTNL